MGQWAIQCEINPPNYSRYPVNATPENQVTKIVAIVNDPTYVHELHFDSSLLSPTQKSEIYPQDPTRPTLHPDDEFFKNAEYYAVVVVSCVSYK